MNQSLNYNEAPVAPQPEPPQQTAAVPAVDPNNPYQEEVTLEFMQELIQREGIRTALLVNRVKNNLTEIVMDDTHYYYRTRNAEQRFIWVKHTKTAGMTEQSHRDLWDAYFYIRDPMEMIRDNLLNFGGERVYVNAPLMLEPNG